LDPARRAHTFEIFGYDFMIDADFKVYLIEANTNPCLELSCPLLARIIPAMLDSAFRIALDPLFPPKAERKNANTLPELLPINKWELVFDERVEGEGIRQAMQGLEAFNRKEGDYIDVLYS
jgi:tubulin monoglycylase TTLL3/8